MSKGESASTRVKNTIRSKYSELVEGASAVLVSAATASSLSRKLMFNSKELVMITEKVPHWNFRGERTEKIPKEEAICRFCFNIFQEDNVLKTKCKCKFTLIHESCEVEWSQRRGNNKCDVCEEDIQNIPVTLSEHHSSDINKEDKPKRCFSCFRPAVDP